MSVYRSRNLAVHNYCVRINQPVTINNRKYLLEFSKRYFFLLYLARFGRTIHQILARRGIPSSLIVLPTNKQGCGVTVCRFLKLFRDYARGGFPTNVSCLRILLRVRIEQLRKVLLPLLRNPPFQQPCLRPQRYRPQRPRGACRVDYRLRRRVR